MMGITLIVVGLVFAYLCWITKKGSQYIESKSAGIVKRRQTIESKLLNNEKLTKYEWFDWYSAKLGYGFLTICAYAGIVVSLIGIVLLLNNK